MERKRSKSSKMPNSFKKKEEAASSSKKELFKRKLSSEETSAKELVKDGKSRIQNAQLNSRVTGGENVRTTTGKLGMERKRRASKSSEKPHSAVNAKGISKRTKSSKEKVSKGILSSKDTSSNELVNDGKSKIQNAQLSSRVTEGGNVRTTTGKLGMGRKRTASKSSEKSQSAANAKGISKRTKSLKGKVSKGILSSKDTSSNELVNDGKSKIQNAQLSSRVTEGGNVRTTTGKLGMGRKRTASKSSEKSQSAANAKGISKRTKSLKGKVSKGILSSKDTSSNELVKDGKSKIQNAQLNSRVTVSERYRKSPIRNHCNEPESLELTSISNIKTCKEINIRNDRSLDESADDAISRATSVDKRCEETSSSLNIYPSANKTRIGRKKKINSEYSLSFGTSDKILGQFLTGIENKLFDKSADDAVSRTPSHLRASSGNKISKETTSSLTTSLSKNQSRKVCSKISDSEHSFPESFYNVLIKSDSKEVIPDTGKSLKKSTGDLFKHWGQNLEVKTHSKGYDEYKKDSTAFNNRACGHKTSKPVNKDRALKGWKKFQMQCQKEAKQKDLDSSKIVSADDKVPFKECPNENIADPSSFPVTAANKLILKRRSDPSYALKENRPRLSI